MKTSSALAALLTATTMALAPSLATARVIREPTPPQAYVGDAADDKDPWISTVSGALEGEHVNIRGDVDDRFGNDWWGGGYDGNYQLWQWQGNDDLVVGGASLRVFAKLFFTEKEVAKIHVGGHNWGANVVNGSVVVMGKTVKNWYYDDRGLQEVYEKTTHFFDKGFGFGVGPFDVDFTARASGNVRLEPDVSMKDLRLTLSATPSTRVNVSGSAGLGFSFAGVSVEGALSPLVQAKMPMSSYLQIRPGAKPCWNTDVTLDLTTLRGTIELVVNYFVDEYRKTIADWAGDTRHFELLDVGEPCLVIMHPIDIDLSL